MSLFLLALAELIPQIAGNAEIFLTNNRKTSINMCVGNRRVIVMQIETVA